VFAVNAEERLGFALRRESGDTQLRGKIEIGWI